MGFFQDLKEDLSLAVGELLPEEEKETEQTDMELVEEEDTNEDETMKELEEALTAAFVQPQKEEEQPKADTLMDVASSQLAGIAGMVRRDTAVVRPAGVEEMEIEQPDAEPAAEPAEQVSEPVEQISSQMQGKPEQVVMAAVQPEEAAVPETEPQEDETEERSTQSVEEMLGDLATVSDTLVQEKKEETTLEKEVGKVLDKQKMNLADAAASDEDAVITAGMEITGDIVSKGNVRIEGSVRGNIEVLGKLNISGRVDGDSKAAEVFADSAHIVGKIVAEGTVKIGEDSVVIGDVCATSAVIAGAIKGDMDVHGPVILDANAIVMGNIKSKSVQINNGATIEGMCSQCYAETSPTAFFENLTKKK